jgi:hypothetical protein
MLRRLVCIAAFSSLSASAFAGEISADEILSRVSATYRSASTYADEGVVVVRRAMGNHETKFTTGFDRKLGYEFSFVTEHPFPPLSFLKAKHRLARESAGYYLDSAWYGIGSKRKNHGTMLNAVAAATGISAGSANTLASLFEPSEMAEWQSIVQRIENAKRDPNALFEDTECWVISGVSPKDKSAVRMYFGKNDYLLRKLESSVLGTPEEQIRRAIRYTPLQEPK